MALRLWQQRKNTHVSVETTGWRCRPPTADRHLWPDWAVVRHTTPALAVWPVFDCLVAAVFGFGIAFAKSQRSLPISSMANTWVTYLSQHLDD